MTATLPALTAGAAPGLAPDIALWKNMTDEELLAEYRETWGAARAGAIDELFGRHQNRIARWCYRFTRDRESALDLAQEILLRAYRNLDSYRGECRFSTWLYAIARNQCLSALQKRATEPVLLTKTIAAELPDSAAIDIQTVVERNENRQRSWRFILRTLDRTEASVMMLHYGEELPLNQVSRMLGLTNKSGAKAYIVSARRKLHAAIRPAGRPL